jgi:hypothetical protein
MATKINAVAVMATSYNSSRLWLLVMRNNLSKHWKRVGEVPRKNLESIQPLLSAVSTDAN